MSALRIHLIVALFFAALSLCTLRTYLFSSELRVPDKWDGLLAAWTISQVQNNILQFKNPFAGNIFSPHANTVAFSDTFVPSALLTLPLRFLTRDPVIHLQWNIFLALWMSALAAYWLTFTFFEKKNQLFAGTIAIAWTWSSLHFHYLAHLHVFGLQFAIGSLAAFFSYTQGMGNRWLILSAVLLSLQAWQSIFPVYVVLLCIATTLCIPAYRSLYKKQWKQISQALIVFIILTIPIILVYANFYLTYHSTRDIREVIHFSMTLQDIWGKFFSPIIYGIVILSFLIYLKYKPRVEKTQRILYPALLCFVLSFGPALHLSQETAKLHLFGKLLHIPLPYTLLYYLLPGFQAFRTPSRFFPFAMLFFLIWAAMILEKVITNKKIFVLFSSAIILLSLFSAPTLSQFTVPKIQEYPAYVSWLQKRPEKVILFLPMYDWVEIGDDHQRMLYTLEAGKQQINGQSGFYPPEYIHFLNLMRNSFSTETTILLKKFGAELLIVDQNKIQAPNQFTLLYQDSEVRIFKI